MGKEALKIMERNWEREDMQAYTTEEERSAWVKHQLNRSNFLYKFAEAQVCGTQLSSFKVVQLKADSFQ